jgi:uncharacterized protein YqeY
MSDAEMKAAIADIIAKEGASGVKDMGKVMAALKAAYAGKMDFGKASGTVKSLLAGWGHGGFRLSLRDVSDESRR